MSAWWKQTETLTSRRPFARTIFAAAQLGLVESDVLDQYYTTKRPDMMTLIREKPTRVLEVGCGAGGFSAQLEAETWGIEPFADAAEEASRVLSKVLAGTYEQVESNLPDRYFDLVVCNDVIEHMPDHDRFLKAVKQKMAPGATLIGSLPNILHLTAVVKLMLLKDWPYSESGILDRTHLRFFTKKSIRRTLEENGYAIEALKGSGSIIRNGILFARPAVSLAGRVAACATIALSIGYYWETQYPQFIFRSRVVV